MNVIVGGNPMMDPFLASNEKMPEYSIAKLDKVGKIHEFKEISKDEYLNIKSGIVQELTPHNFKSTSEL